MRFSLCMPTVHRSQQYAKYTLGRLAESGTLSHPLLDGFHLTQGRPAVSNAILALVSAYQRSTGGGLNYANGWVVYLEDDIDIIDDFLGSVARWLSDFAMPRMRFYPLGCNARRAMRDALAANQASWRFPLKEFYGACAFAIRAEDVPDLCATLDTAVQADAANENLLDVMLRQWHQKVEPSQEFVLTPVPSFIDHLGAVSSLPTGRQPGHYTGRYEAFAGRNWSYRA